jgi:hypothetical protein
MFPQLTKFHRRARILIRHMVASFRGYKKWRDGVDWPDVDNSLQAEFAPRLENPLEAFFASHTQGPGIWKWQHYFDIYDRHFQRFRGRKVNILEIGIYSGGSLEMWRCYFGSRCQIYGVDIEPACKAHESQFVKVFVGDQGDRAFWSRFKQEVDSIDIVIDDGSHLAQQQIVSLEELVPFIRPGGVYICEDVHGPFNEFSSYIHGLAHNLNAFERLEDNPASSERRLVARPSRLQAAIASIHLYPYVVAIERRESAISEFIAAKHGTHWEPFLR